LVRKPEDKKRLERPRRRWEYNIKMYLKETGCEDMNSINLFQKGLVTGCFEQGNEYSGSINCKEFIDNLSD
jgi:hypothetical protein